MEDIFVTVVQYAPGVAIMAYFSWRAVAMLERVVNRCIDELSSVEINED